MRSTPVAGPRRSPGLPATKSQAIPASSRAMKAISNDHSQGRLWPCLGRGNQRFYGPTVHREVSTTYTRGQPEMRMAYCPPFRRDRPALSRGRWR
jgi:hypothetical protein